MLYSTRRRVFLVQASLSLSGSLFLSLSLSLSLSLARSLAHQPGVDGGIDSPRGGAAGRRDIADTNSQKLVT